MSSVNIAELKTKPIEKFYSLIALVIDKSMETKVSNIKNEDKRSSRKVSLLIADGSGFSIDVTIWNQVVDKFKFSVDDIVLLKNFKLTIFRDALVLNSLPFSSIEKTEVPDKSKFVKHAKASKPINGYLSHAQIMTSISVEPRFGWIEGQLLSIEADCTYKRCVKCFRKVETSCNDCNTGTVSAFKTTLYVGMDDTCIRITCFDQCIGKWLNKSTDSLCAQLENSSPKFHSAFEKFIDKTIALRVSFKLMRENERERTDIVGYSVCL